MTLVKGIDVRPVSSYIVLYTYITVPNHNSRLITFVVSSYIRLYFGLIN